MRYTFLDVHGFAGAFSCGATLAGMSLAGKVEDTAAFGTSLLEANRAFLGDAWEAQASDPAKWEPVRADVILGTPPCSAFSGMTSGLEKHGADSPINKCMHDLFAYAARVRPAAVILESVGQAYTVGKDLMTALVDGLEKKTRLAYRVTHILQDNYSLGGCTRRRRYFLVASQVPFGVERAELKWLPSVGDAIGDLRHLPQRWEAQPYGVPPTWWSHQLRSASGHVDGHHEPKHHKHRQRLADLTSSVEWRPGEKEAHVLLRYYEVFGELPESWRYGSPGKALTRDKQLIDRGLDPGGFAQVRQWDWAEPGRVLTGAGPYQVWHPDNRFLTHREAARILGFPDDWVVGTAAADKRLPGFWGKGTSVAPARWVCEWLRRSLDGSPGSLTGELQPDGSSLIDVTRDWKCAPGCQKPGSRENLRENSETVYLSVPSAV